MRFPNNKKFAFTIIDDTDGDTIDNTKPIYDFLAKLKMRTTKTVWVFPPRDKFKGQSLEDYNYRQFIGKLRRSGFEIALHGVGSGGFNRQDILDGLEIYKKFVGTYPELQINHGQNPDNLYWGIKRFQVPQFFSKINQFSGEDQSSTHFWGDFCKKNVKFIRNLTFKNLITSEADNYCPYKEKSKEKYSNYWFSSSDGEDVRKFNKLVSPQNIDRLAKSGGFAIIYTHFASGFVKAGIIDREFRRNMTLLSLYDGWFVPAGELLDYLLKNGKGKNIGYFGKMSLDLKWLMDKLKR